MKKASATFLITLMLILQGCSASGEGADPGITDSPIAYVKRVIPTDNNGEPIQPDIREPLLFTPGGDVYIKDRASVSAAQRNITATITKGLGDVKDISVSYDGEKILFSLRLDDPDLNDNIFFTWNIYEYNIVTHQLRRIIASNIVAEEGNDISASYLPDGRIVFSSDRQTQSKAILLDEGVTGLSKPQFSTTDENRQTKALVLHVMNNDGNNIHQITFNQSHDLDPGVLSDGRILFSRWDNSGNNNAIHLYTVSPDGSNLQVYYGAHTESHLDADNNTVQLIQPYQLADGSILAMSQPFTNTFGGGNIVIIDAENFIDINQPTIANQGFLNGSAQTNATITNIINNNTISPEGRYHSAYPLYDGTNRLLVSKGICQLEVTVVSPTVDTTVMHPCIDPWLTDATAVELPPSYGIWIYDRSNNTEKPVVLAEAGMITTDAVIMQSRALPTVIFDKTSGELDATLVTENVGLLDIRSVYDFGDNSFNGCFFSDCTTINGITSVQQLGDPGLTGSDDRPARFLRIIKAAGQPLRDDDRLLNPPDLANTAFGRNTNQGMREIIGYAPIEPDGSVRIKIPADIAFSIEVLDKFARRIGPRHENWLQVKPGNTLYCNGCHTHQTTTLPLPHGRNDAINPSINSGAPNDGYLFPNTQIPGTAGSYFADIGETMAEARTRLVPSALTPSVDVIFEDVWSDPAIKTDASFSYPYTGIDGLSTASPASLTCNTDWSSTCRSVINYVEHINPLWSVDRGVNTCTNCHSNSVIDGQLNLSSDVSDEEVDHIESYRELLFDDAGQMLDAMGNLVDILITVPVLDSNGDPVLDINGNPVTEDIPDPNAAVPASMSSNGARVSYFMEKLTETELNASRVLPAIPGVDHSSFMTPAELRLISEWLDLGAQYFNNPFDPTAPMN
ncbi:MAG: hypothetical protein OEY66_03025 [Gammaproteobacteria bacterium]|nr:hypothetical protein [Gammaproteobacteria bacterium]